MILLFERVQRPCLSSDSAPARRVVKTFRNPPAPPPRSASGSPPPAGRGDGRGGCVRSRTGLRVARVLPSRARALLGRDRKPQVRETGGVARRGGAGQGRQRGPPRRGSWRGPETLGRCARLALQALKCRVRAWEDVAPRLGTDYPQHGRVKNLDMLGASPVRAHREPKRRNQTGTRLS